MLEQLKTLKPHKFTKTLTDFEVAMVPTFDEDF